MFERYYQSQRSPWRAVGWAVVLSFLTHSFAVAGVAGVPLVNLEEVPAPPLMVTMFDAAPPPPPPPPPKKKSTKRKMKRPEPEPTPEPALVEPEKVPEEVPEPEEVEDDSSEEEEDAGEDFGVEGGVEGGVRGGVVGGVLGGTLGPPPKMLVKAQRKLSGALPRFPASARTQKLTATIAARVCTSASGAVTTVKILRGSPLFNDAVTRAMKTWRYEPYRVGGSAVPACFPVYFKFKLKG